MQPNTADYFNAGIRISLEIGTPLHVEIEGVSIPLQSEFVGMDPEHYLIITSPQPYTMIKHKLFPGNQLIIKYLYKGTVYAFQSKMIDAIAKPERLLFLEYPKIVQHKDLRTHKRMSCYIPATLKVQDESIRGALLDINKKGCHCQVQIVSGAKGAAVNVNDIILLQFPFPGVEGMMQVEGKITNIRRNKHQLNIGLLFYNPTLETEKIIAQYILSVYDYL